MNKQKAIEQVKNKSFHHCGERQCYKDGCEKSIELNTALEIINQIDEPEKVTIPKFVAVWLEKAKEEHFSLLQSLDHWSKPETVEKWLQYADHQKKFALSFIDGYEVEKEKLYVINLGGNVGLSIYLRDSDKQLYPDAGDYSTTGDIRFAKKFTEDEIKKDFEWAFQFAKDVE